MTSDGEAGPSGSGGFKAEAERYHLYVSLACPWAHRTLIFRKLKKLEELISVSVVDPLMVENGWEFKVGDGATGDHLFGASALWQIYVRADPHYSGRVTVPVLWDKKTGTIVSNESAEIIRMSSLGWGSPFGANPFGNASAPTEETVINNYYGNDDTRQASDNAGDKDDDNANVQQADYDDGDDYADDSSSDDVTDV